MRISTAMIYDSGLSSIQKKTSDLLKVQQQLATGRRVLVPSDDPLAAAHALEITQAKDLNSQYGDNQKNARDALALSEGHLQAAEDVLQRVRELTVQLGNVGTLSDGDRMSIAAELRQRFDEVMGIANETDGAGNYLYSGYMGDTKPYTGSADTGVTYNGDEGQRRLKVSASRLMEVSDAGNDIFGRIRNASLPFATSADSFNRGGASIDTGEVVDLTKWNTVGNGKNFSIKFALDNSVLPALTTYDIVTNEPPGYSVLTNSPSVLVGNQFPGTFLSGQPIELKTLTGVTPGLDFGAKVTITGSPANGDTFDIRPSAPESIFKTIADTIHAAETPLGAGGQSPAVISDQVAVALSNLSEAMNNVLRVRANIGARMNELDSLGSMNTQRDLDYQSTLSRLQDVDYSTAITELNKNQVNLDAAQKSFMKVSQLSLFNYI